MAAISVRIRRSRNIWKLLSVILICFLLKNYRIDRFAMQNLVTPTVTSARDATREQSMWDNSFRSSRAPSSSLSSHPRSCDHTNRVPLRRDLNDPDHFPPRTPSLMPQYLDRIIIIPEYKLYFCYLEKVGCAMFNNIFRLLRLYTLDASMTHEEKLYQATQIWFRNSPGHHKLTISNLNDILIDPNWTKAVFHREPTSRFLSAVVNECLIDDEHTDYVFCRRVFGDRVNVSTAVDLLSKQQFNPDPHFLPQGKLCGNLASTIQYYDYIQPLERKAVKQNLQTLFTHVGVPNDFQGKLLPLVDRGGHHNHTHREDISKLHDGLLLRGNVLEAHDTNYSDNLVTKEGRYTTSLQLQHVRQYYLEDYETFNLPLNQCDWQHPEGLKMKNNTT